MKVLIVRDSRFSSNRKKEIESAKTFFEKYTPLEWEIDYLVDRDLDKNLELEGEAQDNLDEEAILKYINKPEYDFIHLDIEDYLWRKLNLRRTLYGQAQYFSPQGITYGRWTERNSSKVKYLPEHLQFLTEVGLGIVHEIGHCLTYKFNLDYTAHYHFYGYARKVSRAEDNRTKQKRWVRTPDPDVYYENLPWLGPVTEVPTIGNHDRLPLSNEFWNKVTQPYANRNDWYPLTNTHIGTDFSCPVGTPVYCPIEGEVYNAIRNDSVLGNASVFLFTYKGEKYAARFAHLSKVMNEGKYKAGFILGFTGNTGMSTGPHLHIDLWKGWSITAKFNKLKRMRGAGVSIEERRNKILEWTIDPVPFFNAIANDSLNISEVPKPVVNPPKLPTSPVVNLSKATDDELLLEIKKRLS